MGRHHRCIPVRVLQLASGAWARRVHLEAYEARVKQAFEDGQGHYGAERICGVIRQAGGHASFPVVKRIMKEAALISSHCRKKQRSLTDSRTARSDQYVNHLEGLEISGPLQVLSSDITYIRTGEGFDYLCQIRDVFTNVVLGYSHVKRQHSRHHRCTCKTLL